MNNHHEMTRIAVPGLPEPPLSSSEENAPGSAPDCGPKVRKLASRQLRRFMTLEPKVLRGDSPAAVHDLRVASRRLEQMLGLLYPAPPPRDIRKAHRKLRRARRALSELRNGDVLLERVNAVLRRKHVARHEAWQAVHEHLVERRGRAFEKAIRKLAKLNAAGLYVRLKGYLTVERQEEITHPRPNPTRGPTPAEPHDDRPKVEEAASLPDNIARSLDRSWKVLETRIASSQRDFRPATIHRARIAVKRLRYLLEVAHELGVRGSAEALPELRRLQRHLGDWHDAEVLEEAMIEMVARPRFLRESLELGIEIEKLILSNRAARSRYQQNYVKMGKDSEGYRKIAALVAYVQSSPATALAG